MFSSPGMAALNGWPYTWLRWSTDIDVELEKLAVDARRASEWIGDAHLADQPAYF
jgi:hypothetical protein